MINFKIGRCPRCGKPQQTLMFSNNPLSGETICFDCIAEQLNAQNLSHADFFCRTYNLEFNPELWMEFAAQYGQDTFRQYTSICLEGAGPDATTNLYYTSSTKDVWAQANREWERCRSLAEILNRIAPIKDSYITRGRLKWGEQYTFEDLIKLDSIYVKTLKANNITNPLQKEAVKTLCKLQIEMDEAIRAKDAKSIKDFSSAWSTFAKQADLETMINETRTDDITTVAELYQYMEDEGFQFKFHDGFDRDEVDRAITDIQNANRRLILESTGLQQLLEDMISQKRVADETNYSTSAEAQEDVPLESLLSFQATDGEIETESDEDAVSLDFNEDQHSDEES